MAHKIDEALLLFLALIGLYSPVAAVSSYIPLLKPYDRHAQLRISIGLFPNVGGIAVLTALVGEPLLVLLGLTTAALSATGGIGLMYEDVPLMLGHASDAGDQEPASAPAGTAPPWRSVVFLPFTFPLTIAGATIGLLIGFRGNVHGAFGVGALLVAALAYALVTGLCVYTAGHAERRLSARAKQVLDRVAGILLVALRQPC